LFKFCGAVARHAKYLQDLKKDDVIKRRREAFKAKNEEKYLLCISELLQMETELAE
jgi:hypothetical protein